MPYSRELLIILTIAICTFLTRVFPFALFGRHKEQPELIQYLGKLLPAAVIAILVVYCLKGVTFGQFSHFVPQFLAAVVVVLLHLWKRNNLLSIAVGTACYMVLIQVVFK
jgi:branched-subunit amino acid transport protein AzlD